MEEIDVNKTYILKSKLTNTELLIQVSITQKIFTVSAWNYTHFIYYLLETIILNVALFALKLKTLVQILKNSVFDTSFPISVIKKSKTVF